MYIIARHEGEEIILLDGLIRVKVVSVQGKIARIGIDAPREISVARKEVLDKLGTGNGPAKSGSG